MRHREVTLTMAQVQRYETRGMRAWCIGRVAVCRTTASRTGCIVGRWRWCVGTTATSVRRWRPRSSRSETASRSAARRCVDGWSRRGCGRYVGVGFAITRGASGRRPLASWCRWTRASTPGSRAVSRPSRVPVTWNLIGLDAKGPGRSGGSMSRIARVVAARVPHHITQRGNRRQRTFFGDEDYETYLRLVAASCAEHRVRIWAWCLMPNHVHLIAVPKTAEGTSGAAASPSSDGPAAGRSGVHRPTGDPPGPPPSSPQTRPQAQTEEIR